MRVRNVLSWAFFVLLIAVPVEAGSNWKTQIQHPDDSHIRSGGFQSPGWVKFLILTTSPGTVYFQDSNLYEFHYDFAVNELPQFSGMTPAAFDDVTLFAAGQQAILGAVLIPPTAAGQHVFPEYGIQLVRQDAYTAVETRDILLTVAGAVIANQGVQPYYMPSFEQLAVAEANATYFATEGFPVSSTARWADGNACYSDGWALGTLKFVTASQIDAAFLAGTLGPADILLTDGIPAEIPFLAGVVSLAPSTPNSHVSLLAQTFNVPFTFLSDANDAAKAQSLVGHRVALRVYSTFGSCRVDVVDTDGELDTQTVDEILLLKAPPVLNIVPTQTFGAYSASTNGLQLSDIRYFGGKAANFGILRQSIPAASPVSAAFSFDLWNDFLDQIMPGGAGLTLRQEIAQQLAPFSYPPDIATLDSVLDDIRDRIKDDTVFSAPATAAVLGTLQDVAYGFDPNEKIRFRSSTNVEDSDQFTGAGLYDSFSGCLADDLDGNSSGPSLCDAGQSSERGVFRAIRKVFASFYNLNAYLERLRHGVDENDVGMALLVHHSFPDPIELANGVATYTRGPGATRKAYLVLQPGANSVTNPEPGQIPEEVDVFISTSFIWPTIVQSSNLLLLGETVLVDPTEYVTLTEHLVDAADHYETTTSLSEFVLEFEFKKTAPDDDLVVTQVRRVPQPDTTPNITPFLLNEPTEYCLFQGESGSTVFGNHRLKSRWEIETQSLWLTSANLQTGFYGDCALDYLEGCGTFRLEGPLSGWPGFSHAYAGGIASEEFSLTDLQNPRSYRVETPQIPELVSASQSPIVLLRDFGYPYDYTDNGCLPIQVDYATPNPDIDFNGPTTTTTDYGFLCPCREHEPTDVRVDRVHTDGGVTIETSYYWPKPIDVAAGYTAPLIEFIETTITGLTPQPIVLTHEHSQTYKPGHHNFTAEYLYEPALDAGVPQQTLDDLEALDVRAIYLFDDFSGPTITTYSESQWGYHCLACRGLDGDGDGRCEYDPTFDCDDGNPSVWARPGEVPQLDFVSSQQIAWLPPATLGAESVLYDTLRSADSSDFLAASCVDANGADTATPATFTPTAGTAVFYLVRAENGCPLGIGRGTLGSRSSGAERSGVVCP